MTKRPTANRTRAAAAKAAEAADALTVWLQDQPQERGQPFLSGTQAAGDLKPEAVADTANTASTVIAAIASSDVVESAGVPTAMPMHGTRRDRPDAPSRLSSRAYAPAHTDWLYHRLSVAGPAADLNDFRAAAAGAGTVPWHLDLDRMAEDLFHLLASPPASAGSLVAPVRSLSLSGARILADQLCAAAARRHALAVARVGHSRACPFDLHALVPVPDAVLRRGPDDPEALDWLSAHWGTTQPLRHVEAVVSGTAMRERPTAGEATWAVAFWSADWTPWQALPQMTARWPSLRFNMRPIYNAL
jgi:hypothetical protein